MSSLVKKEIITAEPHTCPVCAKPVNSAAYLYREASQSEEAHILRCANCTFMFIRPVLIPKLEDRQMETLDDAEMYGSQVMKTLHEQLYLKKEIRLIKKAGLAGGMLLDVGCGSGWISNFWSQEGFQTTGLEPSQARCNLAREKYGLNVVNEYVENIEYDEDFHVCILRHVIEHFQDPGAVLQKIHGALRQDGIVMVIVPNIDNLGRYLFGVDWEWVLPWHCNFFNKLSLETLLEKSGFDVFKTYRTASPFYHFESLARKLDSRIMQSINAHCKVASMLSTAPLALLGLAMGLGDNLTTLARVRKN